MALPHILWERSRSTTMLPHLFKSNRSSFESQETSLDEHIHDIDYVPAPDQYKPGLFGALLAYKLNYLQQDWANNQKQPYTRKGIPTKHDVKAHHHAHSLTTSVPSSGTSTPNKKVKWYEKPEQSNP